MSTPPDPSPAHQLEKLELQDNDILLVPNLTYEFGLELVKHIEERDLKGVIVMGGGRKDLERLGDEELRGLGLVRATEHCSILSDVLAHLKVLDDSPTFDSREDGLLYEEWKALWEANADIIERLEKPLEVKE